MTLGLSLPVDVPWQRLAVSEDMIARGVLEAGRRPRWRSSIAIFGYEPPAEYQTREGQIVSYLKIACTITGFQPDPAEVGLLDRRALRSWSDEAVARAYEAVAGAYYPSYGAILEVTVTPRLADAALAAYPLGDYPYIVDFEPKKRELYELVSDTGEVMSRSLESVNVRKGATTSDAHEVVDMLAGVNVKGEVADKGGGEIGVSGQWGTRDVTQEQADNVRTTDSAREARESFSHTTQLTQMYHQLTSYHVGTNRAVFYILPRPHIVQTPHTFVNGPRLLEGIQEFFLVVMRPASLPEVCVEAYLETAHLHAEPIAEGHETMVDTLDFHIFEPAPQPKRDSVVLNETDTSERGGSDFYQPPAGFEIDLERGGKPKGYRIASVSGTTYTGPTVTVETDHLTVEGTVTGKYTDRGLDRSDVVDGRLDALITIYLRSKEPTTTSYAHTLWLTGRSVGTCTPGNSDFVTWEQPLAAAASRSKPIGSPTSTTILDANRLRSAIGEQLLASTGDARRYPAGTVRFPDTALLARTVGRRVAAGGRADDVALDALTGLDAGIRTKIGRAMRGATRGALLALAPNDWTERLGLTEDEARAARRTLLGLAGTAPAGGTRPTAGSKPAATGGAGRPGRRGDPPTHRA